MIGDLCPRPSTADGVEASGKEVCHFLQPLQRGSSHRESSAISSTTATRGVASAARTRRQQSVARAWTWRDVENLAELRVRSRVYGICHENCATAFGVAHAHW